MTQTLMVDNRAGPQPQQPQQEELPSPPRPQGDLDGLRRHRSAPAASMAIKPAVPLLAVRRSRSPPREGDGRRRRSQSPSGDESTASGTRSRSPVAKDGENLVHFPVRFRDLRGKRLGIVLHRRRSFARLPVVQRVQDGSPIARVGRVRPGDEIWSVNGQLMTGATVERAQALLEAARTAGGPTMLEFVRRNERGGNAGCGGIGRGGLSDDEPPICDRCVVSMLVIVAVLGLGMLIMSGLLSNVIPASFPDEHQRAQQLHQQQHQLHLDEQHSRQHYEQHHQQHTRHHQEHVERHREAERRRRQQQEQAQQEPPPQQQQRQQPGREAFGSDGAPGGGGGGYRNRYHDRQGANQHERRRQERAGRSRGAGGGGGSSGGGSGGGGVGDELVRPEDMRDLYTVLGVPRRAAEADIRKAYRKLSRTAHPDKEGGSEAAFQELQRAYEVLSNGDLRFLYDLHPAEPARAMDAVAQFLEFEDIRAHHAQMMAGLGGTPGGAFFQQQQQQQHQHQGGGHGQQHQYQQRHHHFLNNLPRNPLRGEEDHRKLDVDLADAYGGRTVRVTLDRIVHCRGCRDGGIGSGDVDCALCQRERCPLETHVVERPHPVIRGMTMTQEVEVPSEERCRREHFELDVPVPRGATDDHAVVFPRASHHYPGVIPGDLIVHLHLKDHAQFTRAATGGPDPGASAAGGAGVADADATTAALDLRFSMELSLSEALLGFNRTIRHLDGAPLLLSSAAAPSRGGAGRPGAATVTPHGYRHVVKGKGMPPPPPNPLDDPPHHQPQRQQQQPQRGRTTRDGRRPTRSRPAKPVSGDLLVDFAVVFPDGTLSDEAKAKIRAAFPDEATDGAGPAQRP